MLDRNEIIFLCRRRVLYVADSSAGVRESFCGRVRFTDCEQLSFFASSSSSFWFSAFAMHRNALGWRGF